MVPLRALPRSGHTTLHIPHLPGVGERKEKGRERQVPRKWGFMVTGDKCEGLAETSGFYERCLRLDWLLKHSSANPGTAYQHKLEKV